MKLSVHGMPAGAARKGGKVERKKKAASVKQTTIDGVNRVPLNSSPPLIMNVKTTSPSDATLLNDWQSPTYSTSENQSWMWPNSSMPPLHSHSRYSPSPHRLVRTIMRIGPGCGITPFLLSLD